MTPEPPAQLFAVSDLHVSYAENRTIADGIQPESDRDWLIVAGDIGELAADIEWALRLLTERFATVIWAPGNHELWTHGTDPVRLRGVERYHHIVNICRSLGVATPEDPYPVWPGESGPITIAPLFVLYDYSFHPPGTHTKEAGLEYAYETGVVCTDEFMLHPDPYATREEWCAARVDYTEERLRALGGAPVVLVNHWPTLREVTRPLYYPEFAQWCGTERTADWHRRFNATTVVYGHLHIPRTTWHHGVRFEEVSLGYPREWRRRSEQRPLPRRILSEVRDA
ncbi:3',5'-cyclic AMP phosphodiesterase CpdA [Lipingzhangella halophila]|uniref:3',5'-cyclic AMP phosphodiesterase CpdA n=1 Tax=Lipingzhangella halophila TaxID=1783352 RepID=A0A7W7RJB3_9ACTN|nr:metallophosphoesterase [Lipingzhangella halophila]MBB4933048.1 3',5'-cyclic AMP phosphodiesterase CpdA [Lipingzhangella halophila]